MFFFIIVDYAKYYESLSNNAAEAYNGMDTDRDDSEMFEAIGEETNTQEPVGDTFEENNESGEEFEEDEDIPLVSGKQKEKKRMYTQKLL